MKSKNYDNWDLITTNIKLPIIQVGSKEDQVLPNVYDLRGQTTLNQSAYIIRKAALFLGNDSVGNHMASALNTPRVALFGATLPSTCGGYWNKNTGIEINPFDRYGCASACHAGDCIRANKCINSIPVKFVLETIASVIGKEHVRICDIVHVGNMARQPILEWIPFDVSKGTVDMLSKISGLLTVRHDFCSSNFNLMSNILNQLNLRYAIIADADKVASLSVMPQKVEQVIIKITPENIKEGLAAAKSLQNKYYKPMFLSDLEHTAFNDYKLDMINYPPIARLQDFTPEEKHKAFIGQKMEVQTVRRIIGRDGKFFSTRHDAINNKNILENPQENLYTNIEAEHLLELQFLILKKYE
jgi:hypothetical protein